MSVLKSYAIWNNKGGVGKSTITFHVAARYAERYPNINVLVIDLCPQSNASMMLLGGGTLGEAHVLSLCSKSTPKTVVGYLSSVISGGSRAPLPNPHNYAVQVSKYNSKMSDNLYLLCGDGNLEPMAPAITQAASAPPLTTKQVQPWNWVHSIFRDYIEKIGTTKKNDWMVFVDTNPSFAIYTELAISSVDRLITPVNADDSSRIATNAMFILFYGQSPPHAIYGSWTFAAQAAKHGIKIPQIHIIVGNRFTQYEGAAAAFQSLSNATADALYSVFNKHSAYFTPRTQKVSSLDQFRDAYSMSMRDFNTAGVVSAHLGVPLSQLTQGYHPVHNIEVKVNKERVDECTVALDELVGRLV